MSRKPRDLSGDFRRRIAIGISEGEIEDVPGPPFCLEKRALLEHLSYERSLPDRLPDLGGCGHEFSFRKK
jgi:hypothetical protein